MLAVSLPGRARVGSLADVRGWAGVAWSPVRGVVVMSGRGGGAVDRVDVSPGRRAAGSDLGAERLVAYRSVGVASGSRVVDERVSLDVLRRRDVLRELRPYRRVVSRPWSRGRVRWQPVLSLARSVLCESRLEALRVIEIDRTVPLAWLVTQPLAIESVLGRRSTARHVPGLLYADQEGVVTLENVRPVELRDERFVRHSAMARELAMLLGWAYLESGCWPGATAENLWLLRRYAMVRPDAGVVTRVREAFSRRLFWRLGELRIELELGPVEYPTLMQLMWCGDVVTNLREPITFASRLRLWEGS